MTSLAVYVLLDYRGFFEITPFRPADISINGKIDKKYNEVREGCG